MESESIRIKLAQESFDCLFDSKLPIEPTYEKAYEAAEDIHEKLTGGRRYKSYDSYRVCRHLRKKRK